MGKGDNNQPRYAVEDGHAQVGNGQVDQEVVGQAPHSTVGEHCPQHLESRDHDNLRIRVPHYLVDRLAILETFGYNSKIHLRRKLLATFWGGSHTRVLPRMEATRMTEKAVVQMMSSVFQALTMDNMPLDIIGEETSDDDLSYPN